MDNLNLKGSTFFSTPCSSFYKFNLKHSTCIVNNRFSTQTGENIHDSNGRKYSFGNAVLNYRNMKGCKF